MRRWFRLVASLCLALPLLACAQGPQLRLPDYSHLEDKAVETVDITLGRLPLTFARWILDEDDPNEAEAKRMLKGLRSVHVRHYAFDTDFVYSKADVDAVRSQLSGKGWSPLVSARDRKSGEDVDVYVAMENEKIAGLAVVVCEPRELTIVNIAGSLDPGQIQGLRKQFEPGADAGPRTVEPSARL